MFCKIWGTKSVLHPGHYQPTLDDEDKVQEKRISLRLPEDIAERIKEAAKERPIKMPSHTWIVETVLEKLKKEDF